MKALALLLLLALAGGRLTLGASEALDHEILRFNDAVSKLEKTNDEGLAKEMAKTLSVLIPLARQRMRANEGPSASLTWQAVLSLDESNAEARKYFTTLGTLDAVLAKLKQEASGDLFSGIGGGAEDKSDSKPDSKPDAGVTTTTAPGSFNGSLVTITASKGVAVGEGGLKAGTTITLRYVDGSWGRSAEGKAMASPDAAAAPVRCRLRMTSDPRRPDATLAVVAAGTATAPYIFALDTDCDQLVLCINADAGDPQGSVRYRITVNKP